MEKNLMNLSPELFVPAVDQSASEKINRPSLTYWKDAWLRLKKNKAAVLGMIMLIVIVLMSLFAPMASKHGVDEQNLRLSKLPPKAPALSFIPYFNGKDGEGYDRYKEEKIKDNYWFGTDDLGRDIWVRTWSGTRVSLLIGVLAAFLDFTIGILYGGISGYYGGRVDNVMMRIVEIMMGLPNLVVVILFTIIFEPGITSIVMAMAIFGWLGMARLVRGQVLKLKSQEYVLAARTLGASDLTIVIRHLLPNTLGPIIISVMFSIPGAIFGEAFLSFIGLGIPAPQASLGTLINDGYKSFQIYPHLMISPAIVISILLLSFNVVGDGLRDALDPKMRK